MSQFENDMKKLHGDIFKTCDMIKSEGEKDNKKILDSLAALKDEITELQAKYVKNPPEEYAKDPLFGSYFFQMKDIIDTLSERVSRNDYNAAAMNCPGFCMTFIKMHSINGTIDLTDVMFMWYQQISMTNFMINAGNTKGASMNAKKLPDLYKMVLGQKDKKNSSGFDEEFKKLDDSYNKWIKAIEENNFKVAQAEAGTLNTIFPPVFKMSL